MLFTDIPASERVAVSADLNDLAQALSYISDSYRSYLVVEGAPVTCRIFLPSLQVFATKLIHPAPIGIVYELRKIDTKTEYRPKKMPSNWLKGWEIRVTTLNGIAAAVARASWVELPTRRHPFNTPRLI